MQQSYSTMSTNSIVDLDYSYTEMNNLSTTSSISDLLHTDFTINTPLLSANSINDANIDISSVGNLIVQPIQSFFSVNLPTTPESRFKKILPRLRQDASVNTDITVKIEKRGRRKRLNCITAVDKLTTPNIVPEGELLNNLFRESHTVHDLVKEREGKRDSYTNTTPSDSATRVVIVNELDIIQQPHSPSSSASYSPSSLSENEYESEMGTIDYRIDYILSFQKASHRKLRTLFLPRAHNRFNNEIFLRNTAFTEIISKAALNGDLRVASGISRSFLSSFSTSKWVYYIAIDEPKRQNIILGLTNLLIFYSTSFSELRRVCDLIARNLTENQKEVIKSPYYPISIENSCKIMRLRLYTERLIPRIAAAIGDLGQLPNLLREIILTKCTITDFRKMYKESLYLKKIMIITVEKIRHMQNVKFIERPKSKQSTRSS